MSHALIVQCPACATGYLLPRSLLGSLGARVTCPACRTAFDVDADGAPDGAPPGDERAIAAEVLDALALRAGPALEHAVREHRLFRSHGPDLLEAFDEYRRRAGERATAQAFREELRRRWQVELFPLAEARS